jgi:hypothetical protein
LALPPLLWQYHSASMQKAAYIRLRDAKMWLH